ncbi:hypothetical protein KSP40_PGU005040 [Platanthera guangdongensis]|uniref:Uncharacterized protein n=1 Tax=Platanthera guangdongensis TaxID=2320717 RepID=A0ABR2LYB7_9ASPA
MASSSIFFSSLLAIAFLATAASARPGVHFHPCKTLFISYTFSSSESFDLPQIKTHRDSFSSTPGGYFTVYRVFRPLSIIVDRPRSEAVTDLIRSEPSFGMSSLHERAKDILVVVAGLLFGVGCGALTGGIMYLVWSLFSNQYETCRFGYAGEEEEEEESPKKMGYVKIADPVPVKEGYEGH